jgi:hypothetical protein
VRQARLRNEENGVCLRPDMGAGLIYPLDSNPRSPVRKLAPDVGTPTIIEGMRPRKSGSQRTRRWREQDSNPRSPVKGTMANRG